MAKTELTRVIEKGLASWNPAAVAGMKLNKFREGFAAFEVPVDCGSVAGGLVDFVWVAESLENVRKQGRCYSADCTDDESLWPNRAVLREVCTNTNGLPVEEPFLCDHEDCRYHRTAMMAENGLIVTCVEIKVSKSDFKSLHGHNFVGNANYYAMPKELYPEVKGLIQPDIGVLLYYEPAPQREDGSFPFAGIRKHVDSAYTPLDDTQKLWLTMSTAKRAFKEQERRLKAARENRHEGRR